MLYSYNKYKLILEDASDDKQKEKIRKFLKFEPIIDYIFDDLLKVRGKKYAVWFANSIKDNFSKFISKDTNYYIKDVEYFLKTGEFKNFANETDYNNKDFFKLDIDVIQQKWNPYIRVNSTILNTILDWLSSPLRIEKVDLSKLTLKDAVEKSETWHKELKASGTVLNEDGIVIMTFDDGYYWIDLETNYCKDEANAMGHCASTDSDTLLSLRIKQSPHVTVAFDYNNGHYGGTIHQMKGRNNKKPVEKYHKYIMELLKLPNVGEWVTIPENVNESKYIVSGFEHDQYAPEEDFHISDLTGEQIKEIFISNKDIKLAIGDRYKLVQAGVLDKEEFVSKYSDLGIFNGEIHFLLDDWSDLDKYIFKQDRNKDNDWQYKILNGEGWRYFDYDTTLDFDYNYHWEFNNNALESIIEYTIENDISIDYVIDDGDMGKLKLTNKNMTIVNGDIIIDFKPINIQIKLSKILSSEEYYDTATKMTVYSDEFSELREKLDDVRTRAQESADESEAYDTIIKAIEKTIGSEVKKDEKDEYFKDSKIHIKPNFNMLSLLDTEGEKTILDIINNLSSNTFEESQIVVDEPYYGWDGDIDKDVLSDELMNNLEN